MGPRIGVRKTLFFAQHAERDATFQPKVFDTFDHLAAGIEITIGWAAPGGTHAESGGTTAFGFACRSHERDT